MVRQLTQATTFNETIYRVFNIGYLTHIADFTNLLRWHHISTPHSLIINPTNLLKLSPNHLSAREYTKWMVPEFPFFVFISFLQKHIFLVHLHHPFVIAADEALYLLRTSRLGALVALPLFVYIVYMAVTPASSVHPRATILAVHNRVVVFSLIVEAKVAAILSMLLDQVFNFVVRSLKQDSRQQKSCFGQSRLFRLECPLVLSHHNLKNLQSLEPLRCYSAQGH